MVVKRFFKEEEGERKEREREGGREGGRKEGRKGKRKGKKGKTSRIRLIFSAKLISLCTEF